MKGRFTLALVLSFAVGVLLMAALGGATGIFDRGPTELDVVEARERGVEEATVEVGLGKEALAQEQEERGFQRGEEASEWLSLDRLPNPDGWFTGVQAGLRQALKMSREAFESGYEDGEQQGRTEALRFVESEESESAE